MAYIKKENPKKRGRKLGGKNEHQNPYNVSGILRNLKEGQVWYTDLETKFITSIAVHVNVKVQTKICLLIEDYQTEPKTKRITKVTLKNSPHENDNEKQIYYTRPGIEVWE